MAGLSLNPAATTRGVSPSASRASTSAPASTRAVMTAALSLNRAAPNAEESSLARPSVHPGPPPHQPEP